MDPRKISEGDRFKQLVDEHLEKAVKKHVKPSWFCLRTITNNLASNALYALLIAFITAVSLYLSGAYQNEPAAIDIRFEKDRI